MKRFLVTYKGSRHFQNATSHREAVEAVLAKLRSALPDGTADPNLENPGVFLKVGAVAESLRY